MLKPPSTVAANLMKARELIADKENWTAAYMPTFGAWRHYCAEHALAKVMTGYEGGYTDANSQESQLLHQAARDLGYKTAIHLNDDRTCGHATVLRMFDRAIELSL